MKSKWLRIGVLNWILPHGGCCGPPNIHIHNANGLWVYFAIVLLFSSPFPSSCKTAPVAIQNWSLFDAAKWFVDIYYLPIICCCVDVCYHAINFWRNDWTFKPHGAHTLVLNHVFCFILFVWFQVHQEKWVVFFRSHRSKLMFANFLYELLGFGVLECFMNYHFNKYQIVFAFIVAIAAVVAAVIKSLLCNDVSDEQCAYVTKCQWSAQQPFITIE